MIGDLRERVEIYQGIAATDGYGGTSTSYTLWGRPFADIRPLAAAPRSALGRIQSQTRYKAVIRFRHGFPKDAKLIWRERTFRIAASDDPDNRRERLHLICDEIIKNTIETVS